MLFRHKGLKTRGRRTAVFCLLHLHTMRSAPHEQRACSPRTDAAYYGQKNKPTTFRKSWLGLNISSRPLFMRSAPHKNSSDGKGRDKNLNVQGNFEEFFEKSLMIGGKTVFLHQRHYYMEKEQYIRDLQRRVRQLEHSHNVWTTVVTAIAVTMAFCAITSTYTEHKLRQQVKACSNMVENIK